MYEIKVTFVGVSSIRKRIELYHTLTEAIDRAGVLFSQGCKKVTIKLEDDQYE